MIIIHFTGPFNLYNKEIDSNSVYIGRPSKWGNKNRIYMGRNKAIQNFKKDLTTSDLITKIEELRNKKLFCYCAPLPCHGDILIKHLYPIIITEANENFIRL